MGYPSNLKVISRKLTENIVISSCAFSRFNKLNFGGRMALFQYNGQVLVWSAIPYGAEVEKSLKLLTGTNTANVSHLIIPDKEHTMAAKSFKDAFPNLKVIAMETVEVPGLEIDYVVNHTMGNKLLDEKALRELGIEDKIILDNFEFVYLPYHANKELVMYDKKSKTLFEADLLFNLGVAGTTSGDVVLEQYSPETGYEKGFNPHSGYSFLTRYMQPFSRVGNFLTNKVADLNNSAAGLKVIDSWDFNQIVMCHGNVISSGAKEAFRSAFAGALNK